MNTVFTSQLSFLVSECGKRSGYNGQLDSSAIDLREVEKVPGLLFVYVFAQEVDVQ
jgi:hypothetical protein